MISRDTTWIATAYRVLSARGAARSLRDGALRLGLSEGRLAAAVATLPEADDAPIVARVLGGGRRLVAALLGCGPLVLAADGASVQLRQAVQQPAIEADTEGLVVRSPGLTWAMTDATPAAAIAISARTACGCCRRLQVAWYDRTGTVIARAFRAPTSIDDGAFAAVLDAYRADAAAIAWDIGTVDRVATVAADDVTDLRARWRSAEEPAALMTALAATAVRTGATPLALLDAVGAPWVRALPTAALSGCLRTLAGRAITVQREGAGVLHRAAFRVLRAGACGRQHVLQGDGTLALIDHDLVHGLRAVVLPSPHGHVRTLACFDGDGRLAATVATDPAVPGRRHWDAALDAATC